MRHFRPAERIIDGKPGGLWHYTMRHQDVTLPVGYCADGCEGHPTKEEACQHYQQYLLDHELGFSVDPDVMLRCAVCQEMTTGRGHVSWHTWALCPAHQNRDEVAKLHVVWESWES